MAKVNSMNNDNPDFGQPIPPTKAEARRAKKSGKAERKRSHLVSEMSKKYVGRRVRAPLVGHPTSWHVGEVLGVSLDKHDRVLLTVRTTHGPMHLLQGKALLQ